MALYDDISAVTEYDVLVIRVDVAGRTAEKFVARNGLNTAILDGGDLVYE